MVESGLQRIVSDCIEKERSMRLLFKLTVVILAVTAMMFASDIIGIRFI